MEKYLKGQIELLHLDVPVWIFPNTKRTSEKSPDYNICTKKGEKLKRIGVLWVTDAKEKPEVFEEEIINQTPSQKQPFQKMADKLQPYAFAVQKKA